MNPLPTKLGLKAEAFPKGPPGLQLCSAHQKVLLGPHEEHKAGARLVLPQCVLQPLPETQRGDRLRYDTRLPRGPRKSKGRGCSLRCREGTLTQPGSTGCWF